MWKADLCGNEVCVEVGFGKEDLASVKITTEPCMEKELSGVLRKRGMAELVQRGETGLCMDTIGTTQEKLWAGDSEVLGWGGRVTSKL